MILYQTSIHSRVAGFVKSGYDPSVCWRGRACSCGHRQQFSWVKFYILGERHTYRPHEVSQVKQVTIIFSQISYCHLHSHVSDSPIFDHYLLFFKQESEMQNNWKRFPWEETALCWRRKRARRRRFRRWNAGRGPESARAGAGVSETS